MPSVNNVVRTIRIRGESDGVEKVTGELNKLAAAQQNVAVVSEQSSKRVLSLEDAWKKQSLKLDEAARSQANISRETKIADGALREGLITQQQHAERLNLISQRYAVATQAAGKFANQTGLNRYELLNLSRQMQDVGVSLAGGQSPFVVLTQQGSQILDVFQATTGSVRGFFSQAIGWAARFATSTAGVVTGALAIGGAGAYAALSWNQAQTDITRSLIGIGRQSGASVGDLNKTIAETAATTKLSTGEARDLAIALASTGRIGAAQIDGLTKLGHDFAKVLGLDLPEANKLMAESFADPAKGVDVLGDKLGGFTAKMRQEVKDLAAQLRFDEAQEAIKRGLIPTLARAGEASTALTKIWQGTSKFFKELGAQAGRGLDRLTGDNPAAERLAAAQNELNRLQITQVERAQTNPNRTFFDARLERDIEAVRAKVADFRAEVDKVNGEKFTQIGVDASALAAKIAPGIDQVKALQNSFEALNFTLNTPEVLATLSADQVRQLSQARDILRDQNTEVVRLQSTYAGVSLETARTLDLGDKTLAVARSRTGAEAMVKQEILRGAQLMDGTRTLAEALAIAAKERQIAEAQVNAEADKTLRSLQPQSALLAAAAKERAKRDERSDLPKAA
jgi:phage-related minor tail protein